MTESYGFYKKLKTTNCLLLTIMFSFFLLLGCQTTENKAKKVNEVFEDYYQESLKLYPLNATSQGDLRYNDFLPNFLSDEFRNDELKFYNKYKNQINKYDNKNLSSD